MNECLIDEIKEIREQYPQAFGKPALEEEILDVECRLGGKLPEDYRKFLSIFGAAGIRGTKIMGLSSTEFLPMPTIVNSSLQIRKEFGEYDDIIVIGEDGAGNFIGFRLENPKIFVYDHNFGGEYDIANNFTEYIDKVMKKTLEIQF